MSLKDTVIKYFYKGTMWASEHSAEICTGVAVVTSVSAVAMTVKATKDVLPDLEMHKNNINLIKEHKEETTYLHDELVDKETMKIETVQYEGEDAERWYKKDLTKEYGKVALTVVKHYAIPVALEITAVATIISSNKISRRKNAALATSLTAVQAMYDKYRQNVIEAVGEEKERDIRLGLHKDKATVETEGEDGKTKKTKEDVKVMDEDKCVGEFARIFDEASSLWNKSKGVNRDVLYIKQCYWNEQLIRRGYVFVNEIFEDLDVPCCELGQYYGWIYNENDETRHNYINFNITEKTVASRAFLQGYNPSVLIELEPDGYIADKIWPKRVKITKKAWAGANY